MGNPTPRTRISAYTVAAASVCLVASLIATRIGRNGTATTKPTNDPLLQASLDALVEEAKRVADTMGVFTEVGSRARIDRMEAAANAGANRIDVDGIDGIDLDLDLDVARPRVCETDDDCHHHGVCTPSGSCACVVAYSGVQCGKVVHVSFPGSTVFGGMLPLDVLIDSDVEEYANDANDADDVDDADDDRGMYAVAVEAGPCRVAVGGGLERNEEKTLEIQREIARRLIERFGARDPGGDGDGDGDGDATAEVMGTVVRLLEAFRRCLVVEVVDDGEKQPPSPNAHQTDAIRKLSGLLALLP